MFIKYDYNIFVYKHTHICLYNMSKNMIEHPKIMEFYENTKNIDIVEMNLAHDNLYENIINNNIPDNNCCTIIKIKMMILINL